MATRMKLSGIQKPRWPMKSNVRPGLKNSMSELRPDAEPLDLGPAHPPIEHDARAEESREEAAKDADEQSHREALHGAAPVLHEDDARDGHRGVPVDDRRPGARVARVDRGAHALAD